MRDALGIDNSIDILEFVSRLPTSPDSSILTSDDSYKPVPTIYSSPPKTQEEAQARLREVEQRAMREMEVAPGLPNLLRFLDNTSNKVNAKPIKKAILTRNNEGPVIHFLTNVLCKEYKPNNAQNEPTAEDKINVFNPIVTRSFNPPKPSPLPILHITKGGWQNTPPEQCLMIGDSIDDMQAGKSAGCTTVLVRTPVNQHVAEMKDITDVSVNQIDDIIELLNNGIPLK